MSDSERSLQDDAAYWFARMRSDRIRSGDRRAFLDWLATDPDHAAAYEQCEAAWALVDTMAGDEEIVRMREQALAIAQQRRSYSPPGLRELAALAAALALFVLGGLAFYAASPPVSEPPATVVAQSGAPDTLRTAVGERSAVTLEDGSVIELNTDSLASVSFSGDRRTVRLIRGQALFDVASDPGRPFVVEAAGKRIVAFGTMFDVRVDPDRLQVTLIEGHVRVEPTADSGKSASAAARILEPGEKLVARVDEPPVVLPADVDQQISWRTGRLVFSDEPLGEVVAEINRYSTRKVVLADAGLTELRVSGVFRVGSTSSFVSALDAGFPIAAEERDRQVILRWQ